MTLYEALHVFSTTAQQLHVFIVSNQCENVLLMCCSSSHDVAAQLLLKDNVLQLTASVCCQVILTSFVFLFTVSSYRI